MTDTNKIDVDVNQFPSLTWNFLKINKTHLESENLTDADFSIKFVDEKLDFKEEEFAFLPQEIKKIETGLGKIFDNIFDSFCENNSRTVLIKIPANYSEKTPTKINLNLLENENKAKDFVFIAEENSLSNFIFTLNSDENALGTLGIRIRLFVKNNANLNLNIINFSKGKNLNFVSVGSFVQENAIVNLNEIYLGGKNVYLGNHQELAGYKSSFNGHQVYFANKNSNFDINYVANQTGRESQSFMFADGICDDNSSKTWRGTINFVKGCVDSKGDEQENVLLLSPKLVNKTLPVILCDEEAVEGRHGATIGKLANDILFYMQSRGVDQKEVQRLMIIAKIKAVCRFINDELTLKKVDDYLNEKFGE